MSVRKVFSGKNLHQRSGHLFVVFLARANGLNRLPWKGGPVIGSAIVATNMALYDIAGKALNVPVYRLLGGKRRDKILIHDNGGLSFESVDDARTQARAAVASGVRGLKGNPLEGRTWSMDRRELQLCTDIVQAVREEVGSEIELLLDAHGSPTPELSIAFAQMTAPHHPLFLEEPCRVGSVEALKQISDRGRIRKKTAGPSTVDCPTA